MTTKGHALVIEDDDSIRSYVCELLADMGYEVTQAWDGAGGWAAWRRRGEHGGFALLVTDNNLPTERGRDFPKPHAKAFASLAVGECPVVVHSGDDLGRECEEWGAVYVGKGSRLGWLREGIEKATRGEAVR